MAKFRMALAFALAAVALSSCGGTSGSGTQSGSQSSSVCYVSWTCSSSQCAAVMGGSSGTAGPFADDTACEQWRHQYILSSTCSCGSTSGRRRASRPAP